MGASPTPTEVKMEHLRVTILVSADTSALFWWALATFDWLRWRKWGAVSRELTANAQELVDSRLGWWDMRRRTVLASDITAIEFHPVWGNLTPRRAMGSLTIRRRTGWRLRYRLSSLDQELPRRIAERLAAVLGKPLEAPTR
jgi:hypothetical protein